MRPNPTSAMQKTYDECFLTCSTAVYFEGQNNEAEALRSWKAALDQINYHNANRMPPHYRPRSETEKTLHDSIHQLELQCRERVDLLEALKQSREEASSPANPHPLPPIPRKPSTSTDDASTPSGWLGGGTVPPVDYPDLFRPPLPHRPPPQPRNHSSPEHSYNKRIPKTSLSPAPLASTTQVSRTPSPEKRGMLKTLRPGNKEKRSSSSRSHEHSKPRPLDAAKAATQAWGGTAAAKAPTNGPNHVNKATSSGVYSTTSRPSSERLQSESVSHATDSNLHRYTRTRPYVHSPEPPRSSSEHLLYDQPISPQFEYGESAKAPSASRPPPGRRTISDSSPRTKPPQKDRFRGLIKTLPTGIDEAAAEQIINDIVIQGDEVHWDDIAGLDIAKSALKETVVYPFLRPDLFMGLREPAKGMLLFGPPGTGKTMLARAVATESKSTFFAISASSLTSKFLGESEKLVRALFALAKLLAPSIIFVDEIDSLLSARAGSGEHEATRRIKTEFLIQWSDLARAAAGREQQSKNDKERGDASRVLVLAATNLPWEIDEAARRRFVRRQYIPLPEDAVRKKQLTTLLGHQNHSLTDEEIDRLVELTQGFSGSDITALAKDAAMGPLRSLGEKLLLMSMEDIRPIGFEDFENSLASIRPSVDREGLKRYEDWAKSFGERGG